MLRKVNLKKRTSGVRIIQIPILISFKYILECFWLNEVYYNQMNT